MILERCLFPFTGRLTVFHPVSLIFYLYSTMMRCRNTPNEEREKKETTLKAKENASSFLSFARWEWDRQTERIGGWEKERRKEWKKVKNFYRCSWFPYTYSHMKTKNEKHNLIRISKGLCKRMRCFYFYMSMVNAMCNASIGNSMCSIHQWTHKNSDHVIHKLISIFFSFFSFFSSFFISFASHHFSLSGSGGIL